MVDTKIIIIWIIIIGEYDHNHQLATAVKFLTKKKNEEIL